jgi:hypothetical protein
MAIDPDDILVTLAHPHGDVEVPLAEWMRAGPGGRPLLQPVAARRASTGRPLPLRVIPLRYRNTGLARLLIRARLLPDPWRSR